MLFTPRASLLALLVVSLGCGQPAATALSFPGPRDTMQLLEFRSLDAATGEARGEDVIEGRGFFLPDWRPYQFEKVPRSTRYTIVRTGDELALQALADRSASALRRKVSASAESRPWIQWTWKVARSLEEADCSRAKRDDCAARVMLLYRYEPGDAGLLERAQFETARSVHGEYPPRFMLVYGWFESGLDRPFLKSPYSDRIGVIPVERGPEKAGRWITERRNHLEDFRRVFGEEPPEIGAVAFMVDTDNTETTARSWIRSLCLDTGESGSGTSPPGDTESR